MITYFQAAILGLLQGASELFPISSLGHSVILPRLVGWNIHQNDAFFLTFLVGTHLATAVVLFFFFFRDWVRIARGIFGSIAKRQISSTDPYARLGWLLVVSTIPAGIVGLLLKEKIANLFASPVLAAIFLAVNGLLLYGSEVLRRKAHENNDEQTSDQRLAKLSWIQAVKVGLMQVLALIPGLSRSGATMAGGLLVGLSHEDSLRFSFLLATPIIGAAAVLELPELFVASNRGLVGPTIFGAVCAAVTAYLAVKFLIKFFHTNKLTPFAIYCLAAGVISTLVLYFR